MKFEDLIQSFALLAAVVGLFLNYYENRKTHRVTFFAEYTKRFQAIMVSMSFEVFRDDFDATKLNPEEQKKLAAQMLAYFCLCSEEYDLKTEGFIKNRVWLIWEDGIIQNLRKPAFVWGWRQVESRFLFFPNFHRWLSQWIKNH